MIRFINAFSVFEVYYQNTLKSDSSASDIAWIGSVQLFTICSSSLFIGQLFDRLGPRLLLAFVTLLYPFSCMMNSLATTYWQIFLCQGLLQGISIAITYAVPISCIPQWFNKKRGLATAVVVTGSSLGGILWPVIVLHLLNKVGYGWTWRIIGFMALAILVIATMTVSQRNESSWTALLHTSRQLHESKRQKKPFFYLEAFQSRPYRLLCVAMFFSWCKFKKGLGLKYTISTHVFFLRSCFPSRSLLHILLSVFMGCLLWPFSESSILQHINPQRSILFWSNHSRLTCRSFWCFEYHFLLHNFVGNCNPMLIGGEWSCWCSHHWWFLWPW